MKFFFFLLAFGMRLLQAQGNFPDSITGTFDEAADFVKNIYYQQRSNQAAIYNGTLHYAYPSDIEGIAYFNSAGWQKGDVVYTGILYKNMLMKYDLIKDQLIITSSETTGVPIGLNSSSVKQFSFSSYTFIRPDKGSSGVVLPSGFYQQLNTGNVIALARRTKTISEKIIDNKVVRKFEEKSSYYIFRGGQYFHIENKNDLLSVLKDHKKDVQGFIKEKKINYRHDLEKLITSAVVFYNHL